MPRNHFFVGQPTPPENFIGRESELAIAFDQIHNRSNLAVWGSPGIGKSSFLEQLTSPQVWQLHGEDFSQAIIVLLSCLSIHPFTAMSFWREVLNAIGEELGSRSTLQSEIQGLLEERKTTKDSVRQVLKKLGKQGKFLVLLVDDYDAALRPNDQYKDVEIAGFLSECRSLAYHSRERKYLSLIVSSLRRLNDLGPPLTPNGSPWYNHFLFHSLKPFDERETIALFGGMLMTPALRDGIQEIAGGHPALLQIAGFELYQQLRTGQTPSVSDFARECESKMRQYFQDIWQLSSEEEQTLLMLIALVNLRGRLQKKRYDLKEIELIFTQKEQKLIDLEERGIIIRTGNQPQITYSLTSSLMERWVILEIANSDTQFLKQREKVFLNLMSHRQIETITKAVRWLWQHKEEIPAILEWIGNMATALPKGAIKTD